MNTQYNMPEIEATEEDTRESEVVVFEGLNDNEVILSCSQLTDAERAMIMSRDEAVISYTAKLIREDASGNKGVNLNEFLGQLWDGARDSVRARGQAEV